MKSKRGVAVFGWALILAGTAALIWIVAMAGKMDAIAPDLYYGQPTSDLGYGELELYVRDLRLAPLTLVVAGIAALVSLRLSAGRGRRLMAIAGLILLCSPVLMEEFVAYGDWVRASLPTGYVVVVPGMQLALTLSGLVALLLGARRVTGWHVATIVAAVAASAWMIGWASGVRPWFLLAWSMYVGLATSATVSGELIEAGTVRRVATAGVVSVLAFVPAAWFSIPLNFALGAAALEFNGGHIDVDGLPLYLAGPLSAGAAVLVYLTAVNYWSIFLPKAERTAAAPGPTAVA